MRVFIAVLILIFSFQSWTKADDIRDFEIEGMSIGDSLLDYFSEKDINSFPKTTYNDEKFYQLSSRGQKIKDYETITFQIKKNDKNFIINAIGGSKFFPNKEKECEIFKKKVISEIKDIVKNLKNENYRFYYKTTDDGKSYADVSDFFFKDGSTIRVWCTNWSKTTEKKRNWKDNMSLALNSKEFDYWVKNKAHK